MTQRLHVYLASNQWDDLWIIQQPICFEIQRDEHVLYVERFVSVFTVLRYPRLWRRLFAWLRGARHITPTLQVLAPLPLFHLGHRFPRLFQIEFAVQRCWIRLWMRRISHDELLLWVDAPIYECAARRMGERILIYHAADEMSAFSTSHAPTMSALERRLLGKADLVFTAAEELAKAKRVANPRTYTVWNAISTEAFHASRPSKAVADVEATSAPRVAFVGVLDDWVDVTLLANVARTLRQFTFIIVGDSRVNDAEVRELPNVRFLGRQPRDVVPLILGLCSASIVPFKRTALTERILPLKVFEALAAGTIPVCTDFSTDLHFLVRDGFALVGRSPAEICGLMERAAREDTPARRASLAAFGLRQTWSARWQQMRATIDTYVRAES